MKKLGIFSRFLKKNIGSVFLALTAFYFGAQNYYIIDRVEQNLLHRHQVYVGNSHTGSLKIEDVENDDGQLEKKVKNMETGNFLYTINIDGLPADNDIVYQGLDRRVDSSDEIELKQMYRRTIDLESLLADKLYKGIPVDKKSVDPMKLNVNIITNYNGELEAVLEYGGRSVILTKSDFDYLAENSRKIAQEAGLNPEQTTSEEAAGPNKSESGSNTLWYLGLAGVLGIAAKAYRKIKA